MQITNERILSEFNRCVEWYRENHPAMPHATITALATSVIAEAARKEVAELLNKYNEGVLSTITN